MISNVHLKTMTDNVFIFNLYSTVRVQLKTGCLLIYNTPLPNFNVLWTSIDVDNFQAEKMAKRLAAQKKKIASA